ncbi:MAG TPA: MATE family efflux transporter [Ohtaekwangia sp.]|nr:MATE family efflux transporter [Ohtaekwangia sp.]
MSIITKITSFVRLFKQALTSGENLDYTKGSIDKAIFLLSVPMILEMSMESVFAVVDAYFVGRLNDNDAVATIGLTESVLTLIYSIAMGFSMGATAMIARRVGEKDIKSAEVAAVQTLYIGLALSTVIFFVGVFLSDDILRLMGGSEDLIRKNIGYTQYMLGGNITIMMLFLINGIFRGAGDASIAMRSLILSNGINIVLDPLFIFGWGPVPAMGVEGAAIATVIGRGSGVVYQLYHLVYGKGILKIQVSNLAVRWDVIKRLVSVSMGGIGQFLIASASWIFLYRIISHFGSAAMAGYTFAIRVIIFAILPAWGMANAAATLVGQNLGAGQPDRAEKSVWRAAFFNMIFLAIITFLFLMFARPILNLFSDDPEVIRNGVKCLQIVSIGYVFYAYGMVVTQAFNGAGDTRTPTLINFFGFWLFQIPFAYSLAILLELGSPGVFIAIAVAESSIALAGIWIFRRGKWKMVKI